MLEIQKLHSRNEDTNSNVFRRIKTANLLNKNVNIYMNYEQNVGE